MYCPNCTNWLVKKPGTGEGVKHCPACGATWHILETTKGKPYPDWSKVFPEGLRESLQVSWGIYHTLRGNDLCPCPNSEGKLYKDCCRDWWEGMERSILEAGEKK